jgi:hypothetical protein
MAGMTRAYEEIIDFIAGGSTPSDVAAYQPSVEARAEVESLVAKRAARQLTANEQADLAHYLELEHIMRLAKARARRRLS